MAISDILASNDSELARLLQARALLGGAAAPAAKRRRARAKRLAPAITEDALAALAATKPAKKKKRNLSPDGRKRIAEAARRRWAAQRAAKTH